MRIEHLTSWPASEQEKNRLRQAWSGLLTEARNPTIFQSYEWNEAWWSVFGQENELHLLIARDNGDAILGIAPLVVSPRKQRGFLRSRRVLSFIGNPNSASDYADFVVKAGREDTRKALLEWVALNRQFWDRVEFRNLPQSSSTLRLTERLLSHELTAEGPFPLGMIQVTAEAPTRLLRDRDDDLKVTNKKSLRRHYNWFAKNGALEFRRFRTFDEASPYFEPFFEQHIRRWDSSGAPSLFHDDAERRFYRAVARNFFEREFIHFTAVMFNGRPVAFHFGFEFNGVLTWYKPSFDRGLEKHSPGEVLIRFLMQDAIERGLKEVDFTVGTEAFKYRFCNHVRYVARIRLYREPIGFALAWIERGLRAVARAIRDRSLQKLNSSQSGAPAVAKTHPNPSA